MTDWDKELEKILQDPLFDDVTAPKQRTTRSDRQRQAESRIHGDMRLL